MSTHTTVTVQCDICEQEHDDTGWGSIRLARLRASEDGWRVRRKNGIISDICDYCLEKEQVQS